jgi:DNA polymerase III delta subunit
VLALLCAGCGYTLVRTGGSLGEVRSVAIPTPRNDTYEAGAEYIVADALRREFLRRQGVRLVDDPASADLVLSGSVRRIGTRATSVDSIVLALEYELTLELELEARRRDGALVPLDVSALRDTERYLVSGPRRLQDRLRRCACSRACSRVASIWRSTRRSSHDPGRAARSARPRRAARGLAGARPGAAAARRRPRGAARGGARRRAGRLQPRSPRRREARTGRPRRRRAHAAGDGAEPARDPARPDARGARRGLAGALAELVPGLAADGECVLVVVAEKADGRARWVRAFAEGAVVRCDAPKTEREVVAFVRREAKRQGVRLEAGAAELLAERVGPQLLLLRRELEKAALLAAPGAAVGRAEVAAGTPTLAKEPVWDLTDAIGEGRVADALRVLSRLLAGGAAPPLVLGSLASHFRRLLRIRSGGSVAGPPFVVRKLERQAGRYGPRRLSACLRAIHETDLALKGAGHLPPELALERLVLGLAG